MFLYWLKKTSPSWSIQQLSWNIWKKSILIRPFIRERLQTGQKSGGWVAWFDIKFNHEVTQKLVGEKIANSLLRRGAPDSRAIHAGRKNIHLHLEYIGWLSQRRDWLAGENFSAADVAAAAHLSSLDYIGDVPWHDHQAARDWYARIKSRPSFRDILRDKITSLPPSDHYADLDF